MYNLRTRVKAVSAGSARPQAGMRARALPAAASQVTSTQALELLDDDIESVPETEMYGESVDRTSNAENDVIETVGATQPPTPAQMPTLSPIPFRDTSPDLGAPYPSQQAYTAPENLTDVRFTDVCSFLIFVELYNILFMSDCFIILVHLAFPRECFVNSSSCL